MLKNTETAKGTEMTKCQNPKCDKEATVWYRWNPDGQPRLFKVCFEHGEPMRADSMNLLGRGRMYNGIAEGAGR